MCFPSPVIVRAVKCRHISLGQKERERVELFSQISAKKVFCQFLWERKAQAFDISNFSNKFKHKIVNCDFSVSPRYKSFFLAPSGAQEMLISVRLFVCSVKVCLELSIFILKQSGSVPGQSQVSLRSVSG